MGDDPAVPKLQGPICFVGVRSSIGSDAPIHNVGAGSSDSESEPGPGCVETNDSASDGGAMEHFVRGVRWNLAADFGRDAGEFPESP